MANAHKTRLAELRERLTAGDVVGLLDRAYYAILERDADGKHRTLTDELDAAIRLVRGEIGASHMGTGADVVLIERGDA